MIEEIKSLLGSKYSEAIANKAKFSEELTNNASSDKPSELNYFDGLPLSLAIPSNTEIATNLVYNNYQLLFLPHLSLTEEEISKTHLEITKTNPLKIISILTDELDSENPKEHMHALTI